MDAAPLVEVEHVSKKFCRDFARSLRYGLRDLADELACSAGRNRRMLREGEFLALDDVSFSVRRGECLAIIGHNGAGKSTLLKLINGLNRPDAGRITVRGSIGALIELHAGFSPVLTGRENVYAYGSLLGMTRKEIDGHLDAIVDFAEMGEAMDAPFHSLSSGMKVRLGFAVAAQMTPDVLIVDEVLAVGDRSFRIKCLNRIAELLPHCAVLFVSHTMPFVSRIATHAAVLDHGRMVFYGGDVARAIEASQSRISAAPAIVFDAGQVAVGGLELECEGRRTSSGGAPLDVSHGDRPRLSLVLEAQAGLPEADIRVLFFNEELQMVADVYSAAAGFSVAGGARRQRIEVHLPPLHFNQGNYTIGLTVLRPGSNEVLLRMDNALAFRMRPHYYSWAGTLLPASWRAVA